MSAEYDNDTTIKRVVELAKYEVGEESNGAFDFIFEQWAAQGALSLDNKQTYAVVGHEGDVVCGRVKKPCGYIRFISAYIENIEYPYVNSDWYCAHNCEIPRNAIRFTVTEIDGYLDFANDYDGKCMIIYESLNINSKGDVVVTTQSERAVIAYIKMKYYGRKGKKGLVLKREYAAEYAEQRMHTRGILRRREFHEERHQVMSLMNGGLTYGLAKKIFTSNASLAGRH